MLPNYNIPLYSDYEVKQYINAMHRGDRIRSLAAFADIIPAPYAMDSVCQFDIQFLNCCAMMYKYFIRCSNVAPESIVLSTQIASRRAKYFRQHTMFSPMHKKIMENLMSSQPQQFRKMLFCDFGFNIETFLDEIDQKHPMILCCMHESYMVTGYRLFKLQSGKQLLFLAAYSGRTGRRLFVDYETVPLLSFLLM